MKKVILSSLIAILFVVSVVPSSILSASMLDNVMTRSDYFSPAENAHYSWSGVYDYILTVTGYDTYTIGNKSKYVGAGAKAEVGFKDSNGASHNKSATSSASNYANASISFKNYTLTQSYQKSTAI